MVLNGLLEELGLAGQTEALLRALDKLANNGREEVIKEMVDKAGIQSAQAERVLSLAEIRGSNAAILERLSRDFGGNAQVAEGIRRLQELLEVAKAAGIAEEKLALDLATARGLDYYTGTVFETFLTDLPAIGSVCSGGRYDNLAGLFTKQPLPGVGASLGLDRLLTAMEELKMLKPIETTAPVLIVQFQPDRLGDYQRMGRLLRAGGIGAEVFPEAKKVGQQLQYAERRGFRVALIAGPDEFAQSVWKIKNLARRQEQAVPEAEVAAAIQKILHENS
jgi:histidyl-tRNA synthetase